MSSVTATWRRRRQAARTRRAIDRALERTTSPGMEQELHVLAGRQSMNIPR